MGHAPVRGGVRRYHHIRDRTVQVEYPPSSWRPTPLSTSRQRVCFLAGYKGNPCGTGPPMLARYKVAASVVLPTTSTRCITPNTPRPPGSPLAKAYWLIPIERAPAPATLRRRAPRRPDRTSPTSPPTSAWTASVSPRSARALCLRRRRRPPPGCAYASGVPFLSSTSGRISGARTPTCSRRPLAHGRRVQSNMMVDALALACDAGRFRRACVQDEFSCSPLGRRARPDARELTPRPTRLRVWASSQAAEAAHASTRRARAGLLRL